MNFLAPKLTATCNGSIGNLDSASYFCNNMVNFLAPKIGSVRNLDTDSSFAINLVNFLVPKFIVTCNS